jgi:hypothetical protein
MNVQSQADKPGSTAEQEDAISIPLYVAGLLISILGILAVNSALSDSQVGSTTIVLTTLGFFFSIGCRWLQIKPKMIEGLVLCICLYFAFRFLTHTINTGFFIPPDVTQGDLVMAVILAWLTVVRSWIMTRDESVVFTTITSVAMIGLVGAQNINGELLVYFFLYVVCATFILLHQTYLTQRSWAVRNATGAKDSGIITLQGVLATFSGVLAILIAMLLVVPLRAVGTHLSLANALKNLVGTNRGADNASADSGPTVSLSDDGTFRVGTGNGFSASDEVVLKVLPADRAEHYYRGRTYDTYTGNGWISSEQKDVVPLSPMDDQPEMSDATEYSISRAGDPGGDNSEPLVKTNATNPPLITKFKFVSSVSNMLYLPYGTTNILLPSSSPVHLEQSPDNNVKLDGEVGTGYEYSSSSIDPTAPPTALEKAPSVRVSCPAIIRNEYIDQKGSDIVSVDDQQRLFTTAQMIVDSVPIKRRTDANVAEAIRQWVSQRCVYSLDVGAVPSGDDSVSYFLFTSRKGYCDLFASSMAILCRYAGLPARIATGFDPGVQNGEGGYDLRARDKHAWVEVWFNRYGWQQYDTTEGSREESTGGPNHYSSRWFLHALTDFRLFLELNGYLPVAIALCSIIGLLYVLKIEVLDKLVINKRSFTRQKSYKSLEAAKKVSGEAAALYSRNSVLQRYYEFEYILKYAGVSRDPSQTPAEFLEICNTTFVHADTTLLPDVDGIIAAAKKLTDDVMMASYAPIELVGETLVRLEADGSGVVALDKFRLHSKTIRKSLRKRKLLVRS